MQSLQQVFMITSRQQLFFDREHRHCGPKNMKISSQSSAIMNINENLKVIKEQNSRFLV